jgi:thioredoxin-related protein
MTLLSILLQPLLMLLLVGPPTATAPLEDKVQWLSIEQAQELNKKNPRKIFVDVYTDWCGWCKKMDKTTFANPTVAKYINKNYYAVKMDAEQAGNIIFKGQVYTFNERSNTHNLAIEWLGGQMSYPTTVYLDEKLNLISPIPGYLDAKQFDGVLHFFAENHHKKKEDINTFLKNYKSSI